MSRPPTQANNENRPPSALVIGAGSVIGRAICKALARSELAVTIAGPIASQVEADRAELGLAGGQVLDLMYPEELEAGLSRAHRDRAIDCLVSCAGFSRFAPLEGRAYEVWKQIVDISLLGHLHLLGALTSLPEPPSAVVFISSINARIPAPGYAAYSAAKAGLEALVRAAALELAPCSRVNAVAPGPVKTPGKLATNFPAILQATESRHLVEPRLAEPAEIADAVDYLVSGRARWITGQVLTVDGGCGINYGQLMSPKRVDQVVGMETGNAD